MKTIQKTLIIALFPLLFSCKDKLDLKPNQSLVIPTKVDDYLSLMYDANSTSKFRGGYLAEMGSDNYYLPFNIWNSGTAGNVGRNSYIWNKDPYQGGVPLEWETAYRVIYIANNVLEGLEKFQAESSTKKYQRAKGCALFFRGYNFLQLAQVFCKPYSQSTASNDPGIILNKGTNPLKPGNRATVAETYEQIIADLTEAFGLLDSTNTIMPDPYLPTKAAAAGALSRTYMSMRQYDKALVQASSSLSIKNTLIDYNTLNANNYPPFAINFGETLYLQSAASSGLFSTGISSVSIDPDLYQSYNDKDLRKTMFFYFNASGGNISFKGPYSGDFLAQFTGIATDEIYLNRAECYARAGDVDRALTDLNTLMRTRWKNDGSFVEFTAASAPEALSKILTERRKELVFRGLRWMDLRRLNLEGANITLTRVLNGTTYTLKPNSLNWVYPIPLSETNFNPVQQNERE